VMELVEGKNVSEVLQKEGALAVPRAIRIARQVGLAIGMAHKLGIVHRDLKPGNIILTTDEQGQEIAKVLDFGIAKLREAAGEERSEMTMTGMVVGTPLYMSPEQFLGKKAGGEVDGRTDIYSLGVVLYQMITAQLPFDAETPYALMLQHLQGTVRPPHELKPELHIPLALSQVILRAMEKSREQRFQTAEEFVAALDQVTASSVASEALDTAIPKPRIQAVPTPSTAALAVPVSDRQCPNCRRSRTPRSDCAVGGSAGSGGRKQRRSACLSAATWPYREAITSLRDCRSGGDSGCGRGILKVPLGEASQNKRRGDGKIEGCVIEPARCGS
jgi:serine/threonine protein kinase